MEAATTFRAYLAGLGLTTEQQAALQRFTGAWLAHPGSPNPHLQSWT